jgi:glycerophosphoryl diester phosphodiesterase
MKIIGHRGAAGLAPENTIAALRKGLEHHADMLELDLRVTGDGVVVLHHDPELTDPNGDRHLIADCTYAELKDHKKDLATFEEILAEFVGKVPLYVEAKPDVPSGPITKIIEKSIINGLAPKDLVLASFSQPILLELHAKLPQIDKVVLEKWSGVRATRRARQLNTKLLCMNQKWLWWGFIRQMSRHSYKLMAYTLNDPKKARRWARHGLYGLVTDYPDRFEK